MMDGWMPTTTTVHTCVHQASRTRAMESLAAPLDRWTESIPAKTKREMEIFEKRHAESGGREGLDKHVPAVGYGLRDL